MISVQNQAQHILSTKAGGGKVLSFGELLLRICPDGEGSWLQHNSLPFYVGGAEANVAAALALWQVPVAYFSAVPDNLIGHQLVQYLSEKGIDVSRMLFGGDRLGLYFLPKGKDLKNAAVIYDRAYSAFSGLKKASIDWDKVLEDVGWLNFSAISPALNGNIADICLEGAAAAAHKGIVVSLDLNYRAKLWQYGKAPHEVMPAIAAYCDVIMGNIWSAEKLLGCQLEEDRILSGTREAYQEHALRTSTEITQRFPSVSVVANTFRFNQPDQPVHYYATLYSNGNFCASATHTVTNVVDNVGSGDCFMAGLIYGFLKKLALQPIVDFAAAAAVNKLTEAGDATHSTVADIQNIIKEHER